ncbi:hypothetical protein AALO_G00119040 [Alosa alosa]|uniref:Uncharacterized protein n=1 Tax=Alosa alosa TaxID=278164 RepID=A0AAV6GQU6_9TELE|nr:hypothetical protein AALO_G00119040 [Alosa alosa]
MVSWKLSPCSFARCLFRVPDKANTHAHAHGLTDGNVPRSLPQGWLSCCAERGSLRSRWFGEGSEARGAKLRPRDLIEIGLGVQITIWTVAAPDLLDPKSAVHNCRPRLSFSSAKPLVLSPPVDELEEPPRVSVMRWKTVSAIFCLVVLYLIMGATVFRALEQPHESSQKLAILMEKLDFLVQHPCVNSSQLEDLVKVR